MPSDQPNGKFPRLAGDLPPLDAYDADIIILSLNRPDETIEAISSALAQRGGSFHVTVLDQGSSPECLSKIRRKLSQHRHAALYAAPKNLGVAAGRNAAAALGHGTLIVALDNDAVFQNEWVVANAARCFRQSAALAALGFCILSETGTTPDLTSWGYPKPLLPRFKEQFDTTTFVGAGHAMRRSAWTAVKGYDPDFFFTWEEYDFCLRAIALGWRVAYDGRLAVIHKVSPAARVAWSGDRMYHFVRNRLLIDRKWGRSWLSLTPRILSYLFKAQRHGCLAAARAGLQAAFTTQTLPRRKMPKKMRLYIRRNETAHRGFILHRIISEALSPLTPEKRSLSTPANRKV